MTCREYLPLINDLTDGCLNRVSEEKVRNHLTDCRDCSGELKETKHLKSLLKKLTGPKPSTEYFARATSHILQRISGISKSGLIVN